MLSIRQIAPALFTAALVLTGGPGLAETTAHQGHAVSQIALSLNGGQKWQGDENMHKGMDAIRQALATRLEAIHEVAFDTGFSAPANFHRAFRKWTNRTPGSYRL